jgi:hypothetical protein
MRIQTAKGKIIDVLLESDLGDYRLSGERIRSYCPVHGSTHQKSLSIDHSTGWGRCFNANCNATVLIREFNPETAGSLLQRYQPSSSESELQLEEPEEAQPEVLRMRKTPAARPAARWQRDECAALHSIPLLFLPKRDASFWQEKRDTTVLTNERNRS